MANTNNITNERLTDIIDKLEKQYEFLASEHLTDDSDLFFAVLRDGVGLTEEEMKALFGNREWAQRIFDGSDDYTEYEVSEDLDGYYSTEG